MLVGAYSSENSQMTDWDFSDEHPTQDARGYLIDDYFIPDLDTQLVNTVLTNGARYYVDHAHPEVSTPECRTAMEVVLYDRAGEEIIRRSTQLANQALPSDFEIVTYKNNSDGKGNSYGCHENYLMARSTPFSQIAAQITPHFVSRQIFCGAGKMGSEHKGSFAGGGVFQLSQRADFFEEEIGLETTIKRPIVNTRDEPHCDPTLYRRLHVIAGDANMSEVATLLKVGTTAIILAMIEDGCYPPELLLARPVEAIREFSHDSSLTKRAILRDGQHMTALQIQYSLLEAAHRYAISHGLDAVDEETGNIVLQRWEEVLNGLSSDPLSQCHVIDWVAKKRIIDGFAQRHGLPSDDARLKAIDLQYHDMRPERSLAARSNLQVLTRPEQVQRAITQPPESTRAYFRGTALQRWPDQVVAANWDSVIFDAGSTLHRVPMPEPLRGTKALVGSLFESCQTPRQLIDLLGKEV